MGVRIPSVTLSSPRGPCKEGARRLGLPPTTETSRHESDTTVEVLEVIHRDEPSGAPCGIAEVGESGRTVNPLSRLSEFESLIPHAWRRDRVGEARLQSECLGFDSRRCLE